SLPRLAKRMLTSPAATVSMDRSMAVSSIVTCTISVVGCAAAALSPLEAALPASLPPHAHSERTATMDVQRMRPPGTYPGGRRASCRPVSSVPEDAPAGEQHGDVMLVRGGDDFLVAHGAAGLDDGAHACGRCRIDAVAEREERVGGECCSRGNGTGVVRLHDGDA